MADHQHAHPVQPPEGSLLAPGPCRACGKTYRQTQAERQLLDGIQRLEAERIRPVPQLDPLDELFRELIGVLAGMCADAGMMPP